MSDAASGIRHGRVLFVSEIDEYLANLGPDDIVSLRTFGRLTAVDFATQRATIEHRDTQLSLDISTLYEFIAQLGALYEFVGEFDRPTNALRCRIWRSLAGCDMSLFASALALHRESIAALDAAVLAANAEFSTAVE